MTDLPPEPPDYFRCRDCRVNTNAIGEWYMVKPDVWAATSIGPKASSASVASRPGSSGASLPTTSPPARLTAVAAASPRDCSAGLAAGEHDRAHRFGGTAPSRCSPLVRFSRSLVGCSSPGPQRCTTRLRGRRQGCPPAADRGMPRSSSGIERELFTLNDDIGLLPAAGRSTLPRPCQHAPRAMNRLESETLGAASSPPLG
jgi:hypothetical protein